MIPTQNEVDWENPKQHFVWALKRLPMMHGVGQITHPTILEGWSEHLTKCGFAHRDYLASLADENGHIHVSQLPEQQIKYQPVIRGPRHEYNAADGWVDMDAPDSPLIRLPDVSQLTLQEQAVILEQFHALGLIPTPPPTDDVAKELT